MKKAKNETAKNNEKAKDIAVDIIRDKEDSTDDLGFKKVFHGFDPDEVKSYINELRQSVESSTRMHESKLSSLISRRSARTLGATPALLISLRTTARCLPTVI